MINSLITGFSSVGQSSHYMALSNVAWCVAGSNVMMDAGSRGGMVCFCFDMAVPPCLYRSSRVSSSSGRYSGS
jgi:hypothetical protein